MSPVLNTANKLYVGSNAVQKVLKGAVQVWQDWTPKSYPGLTVWLDASQLALADGAAVSSWPDISGKGNHGAIVGTPLPTVRANALKGQRVVRFNINEGRVRGSNGLASGVPSYNFTMLYVSRIVTSNVGRVFAGLYPNVNYLVGSYVNGYDCMYDGGFVANGVGYPAPPTPWKLYESDALHDGTNYTSRFFINGVLSGTQLSGVGMGQNYNLSGYDGTGTQETCDCEVAELLIYNRKLSDVERQKVESYLKAKWGL